MLQTGIFWFFIEREDLTATGPRLTLPIGNYVTLTMGSQLDTSSQISELKGTRGLRGRTHALHSWPRCFVLSVKNKAYTEQRLAFRSNICWHTYVSCWLGNMFFFVLKLDFPGKNNGKIKGDKCLVGQREQNLLPKKSYGLVSAKLLAMPASLAGVTGWGLHLSQQSCHLGPTGGPGARHTGSSVRDGMSQLWSASVLRTWLWHCLRVPRGLGIAGLILDVRVLRLLPTHSQGLCHAAGLWRASTSMQPRCSGHSWGGQPRRLA